MPTIGIHGRPATASTSGFTRRATLRIRRRARGEIVIALLAAPSAALWVGWVGWLVDIADPTSLSAGLVVQLVNAAWGGRPLAAAPQSGCPTSASSVIGSLYAGRRRLK